ncbi:MAG TPA: hypothetical protein VGO47_06675 [Chlamydiales bacterium]|jgi:hypothetical protein|nr:hypothetical protein [Chlamydiales bacterium]
MSTPVQAKNHQLHRYITEVPRDMAGHHQNMSRLYCAAMVIAALGALTIFGGVTALYLGLLGETSLSGWATLGIIVSACVFAHGVDVFSKWQIDEQRHVKWYNKLDKQLQTICKWDETTIGLFYAMHARSTTHIKPESLALLRKRNPTHPLLAMLPLVARYQLTEHYTKKWTRRAAEQVIAIGNVNTLPVKSRNNMRKLHQALETRANEEKTKFQKLAAECQNLLVNPAC